MAAFDSMYSDPAFVAHYVERGPPAFMPGHAGVLQMAGMLIAEAAPPDGVVLVVGAGGGLDTRALAGFGPDWRFVGVDPSAEMLRLARTIVGPEVAARVQLIEGTVDDAPDGPFDAGTLILVLGILPDNGAKLALLRGVRRHLRPGAPFILIDRCDDREGRHFDRNVDRYARYAQASGVPAETVAGAHESQRSNPGLVPPERNVALLAEAGFVDTQPFYQGLQWFGWVTYAP